MSRIRPGMWVWGAVVVAAGLAAGGLGLTAPARDGDPLLIGTKWKGTLTQKGAFAAGGEGPPAFDAVLTVTARDRGRFEAELRETAGAVKLTYLVKGEVVRAADGKAYAVTFRSTGAKDVTGTSVIVGVPYTATLTGRTIAGTWKLPDPDVGADVQGGFTLELTK